jgi:hypothetical protein
MTDITSDEIEFKQTEIERLADKYGVHLVSAKEGAEANGAQPNNMSSAGSTIFLNEFDDPDIELAAFLHELGHVELGRTTYFHNEVSFCLISKEALAWEIGFSIAKKEGYDWDYYSKQYDYARKCLLSYLHADGRELGGFK